MGLLVQNYETSSGIILDEAYVTPNYFSYDTQRHSLCFDVSIWENKAAYLDGEPPIEDHVGFGAVYLEYDGTQDMRAIIDNGILGKINIIKNYSDEECELHNSEIELDDTGFTWIEHWDIFYRKLTGAVSDIPPGARPDELNENPTNE